MIQWHDIRYKKRQRWKTALSKCVSIALLSGGEPVLDWLRSLSREDRHAVGRDLMRVQYGWPIGMPLCRPLGQGLWEVRTSLPSGNIARVMFCPCDGVLAALHGFVKKTKKPPQDDMEPVRKRKKEIES
jgi:phage-related protein